MNFLKQIIAFVLNCSVLTMVASATIADHYESQHTTCATSTTDYETIRINAYNANNEIIAVKFLRRLCDVENACWEDLGWVDWSIHVPPSPGYPISQNSNGDYVINNFPLSGEFSNNSITPSLHIFIFQPTWGFLVINQTMFEYEDNSILNFN